MIATAARTVTRYGHEDVRSAWLLESGRIHPDDLDRDGWPLIADAVNEGRTEVVREFLQRGANPNPTNAKGEPVGLVALSVGYPEITRMLCAAGANPNTPSEPTDYAPVFAALMYPDRPDYKASANIIRAHGGVCTSEDAGFRLVQANVRPDGKFLVKGPMPKVPEISDLEAIGRSLEVDRLCLEGYETFHDKKGPADLRIVSVAFGKVEWGVIRLEQHDDIVTCLLGPRHLRAEYVVCSDESQRRAEDCLAFTGFYIQLACYSKMKPGTWLKVMNLKMV